jgi:general secretion pathway protein H
MRTSAAGNDAACATHQGAAQLSPPPPNRAANPACKQARAPNTAQGFTLLELLVVIAIMGIGMAVASLALRDSAADGVERDAQRLAALLETGRIQSRASGVAVRWRTTPDGFAFDGLPADTAAPQAHRWLYPDTTVRGTSTLQLGPDPILEPQSITLTSSNAPGTVLRVGTDGLRPFDVQPGDGPAP